MWESVNKYKPKFVFIEFNPFIPDDIEFIQEKDINVQQGNSILSMVKLAKKKGYELICINQENAFFVDRKYYHLFNLTNNDIITLKHYKAPLQVFQLYDGTIVFEGAQCLFYLNIPIDFNAKFQILPKFVRKANFPWRYKEANLFIKILFRLYTSLLKNHKIKGNPSKYCWNWKETYMSLLPPNV